MLNRASKYTEFVELVVQRSACIEAVSYINEEITLNNSRINKRNPI